MGRRTLLLVAALVVAALGTTGVFLYVNGVDKRAEADFNLVQVLVATAPIEAGTTARDARDRGALDLRPFLAKSVAGLGALSDISSIADQVALAPIAAGEAITAGKFGAPSQASTLPIPEGKLAVSLQVDVPARVAGFVAPGDDVVIFLTTGLAGGQDATRVLLPRVQVIAAGATTLVPPTTTGTGDTAQPAEQDKALITLAVDQTEAQKIVYAQAGHGTVTFGLLGDTSKIDKSGAGTTAQNLFD